LPVSFIREETDADGFVTDFDGLERFIANATEESCRLFLIDCREPRLSETLRQASYDGNRPSRARRLIALFNSRKSKVHAARPVIRHGGNHFFTPAARLRSSSITIGNEKSG